MSRAASKCWRSTSGIRCGARSPGRAEVRAFCRQLNAAGSSGFLCGRAIWKDAIGLYTDEAKMEHWLKTQGVHNFLRANAFANRALPWFGHRKFC